METIKVICPATVDKDVQKIKEELKKDGLTVGGQPLGHWNENFHPTL